MLWFVNDTVLDTLKEVVAADIPTKGSLLYCLRYLEHYAEHDGRLCLCALYPDYAPLSFQFTVRVYPRTDAISDHLRADYPAWCPGEEQFPTVEAFQSLLDWAGRNKAALESVVRNEPVVFKFNGGLIFHGVHDRGGDGGGPTFSVNLVPTNGWQIHT